jgi:hypothetical protein
LFESVVREIIGEIKMVKHYQSCRIHVLTKLNLDSDCWVPEAEILWEEYGERRHQRLKGPDDRFKIIDEAQLYAIEMAKSWIDNELTDGPSPSNI